MIVPYPTKHSQTSTPTQDPGSGFGSRGRYVPPHRRWHLLFSSSTSLPSPTVDILTSPLRTLSGTSCRSPLLGAEARGSRQGRGVVRRLGMAPQAPHSLPPRWRISKESRRFHSHCFGYSHEQDIGLPWRKERMRGCGCDAWRVVDRKGSGEDWWSAEAGGR